MTKYIASNALVASKKTGHLIELVRDMTSDEFAELHLTQATSRNVMSRIAVLSVLVGKPSVRAVIRVAVARGLISKKKLQHLYQSQTDECIQGDPLFRLCDYAGFLGKGGKKLFSIADILALEEARHGRANLETYQNAPCNADIAFFLIDEDNRSNVPNRTLLRYGECNLAMDDSAIVDVELVRRKLVKYNQDELRSRLLNAARESPQGNGVKVYLSLLLGKTRKGGAVREVIATTIIDMIIPTSMSRTISLSEARSMLTLYLSIPLISNEDKRWVKARVQKSCDLFASLYSDFVKKAEADDPLRLK